MITKFGLRYTYALLTTLSLTLVCLTNAKANHDHLLGGRAFSPPTEIIPMGAEWESQGVTHKINTDQKVNLAIALDQQLYPSLGPMIQAFAKSRGIKVAVQNGTCGVSAGLLSDKAADIGGFCCPPGLTDRLPGLTYHTIGIGALALLTHADNAHTNVSAEQARSLFANDIRDWSELPMSGFKPGPDTQVRAFARLHCKARPGHWRLILDNEQEFGWNITEVSAIKDMVKQVSVTPGSLGYETLWHIGRQAQLENTNVKVLNVDGHSPADRAALAQGKYPLYRVFNVTTWAKETPAHSRLADELVDHLIENASKISQEFAIVPASALRKNNWKFEENELIGAPD
ncbi:substrate-binding domain-containing protein [Magnetovibrio sp. PR-2]|uniref:substrate-binding domain-containing protein n=1 Tax=Magnetovibrio sp. PR-2 TaxID=3120356 RepID=UPI002FCE57EB